jgi:hypothetical protein
MGLVRVLQSLSFGCVSLVYMILRKLNYNAGYSYWISMPCFDNRPSPTLEGILYTPANPHPFACITGNMLARYSDHAHHLGCPTAAGCMLGCYRHYDMLFTQHTDLGDEQHHR